MAKKSKKASLRKAIFYILGAFSLLAILFLTAINVFVFFADQKVLGTEVEYNPKQEETFWLDILAENPTYFAALVELTRIKMENKEAQEAFEYLQKAKVVNPNSLKISDLEKQLKSLY